VLKIRSAWTSGTGRDCRGGWEQREQRHLRWIVGGLIVAGSSASGRAAACSTRRKSRWTSPARRDGGRGTGLDCSDVGGPFVVRGDDPNRFDADSDGIGCEPWP